MNGILDDLKNVFRKPDNALLRLIIINVIVFLGLGVITTTLRFFGTDAIYVADLLHNQVVLPGNLSDLMYRPWTVLTYAFGHADFLHILGNMLALYWFGLIIAEYLGSKKLISIYVLGALAGSMSFILLLILTPYTASGLIGASGAVFAVMVAAATLSPNYTFYLLFIGPVRIKYIAALWVVLSYIALGGFNAGGNLAHLAGALLGYVYIIQLKKGTDLGSWIHDFMDYVSSLFQKKSKMHVSHNKSKSKVTATTAYRSHNKNTGENIPDQDEIDAILDKISASGYESLTKEEKQKLFRASKS